MLSNIFSSIVSSTIVLFSLSIEVYFLPTIEDEPDFSLDDNSIFLIHKYQDRHRLVQGHAEKLDSFVHKIKEALEKIKTKNKQTITKRSTRLFPAASLWEKAGDFRC